MEDNRPEALKLRCRKHNPRGAPTHKRGVPSPKGGRSAGLGLTIEEGTPFAQMEEAGIVRIDGVDGPPTTVAVHGGFLHVTPETVTILAESAEISEEIDVARARKALERADHADPADTAAAKRAQVRLRAAGEAG